MVVLLLLLVLGILLLLLLLFVLLKLGFPVLLKLKGTVGPRATLYSGTPVVLGRNGLLLRGILPMSKLAGLLEGGFIGPNVGLSGLYCAISAVSYLLSKKRGKEEEHVKIGQNSAY